MSNIIGGNFGGVDLSAKMREDDEKRKQQFMVAAQVANEILIERLRKDDLSKDQTKTILNMVFDSIDAFYEGLEERQKRVFNL